MKIAKDKVGIIHYTLKDDHGAVLDSSQGKDPLSYVHGMQNLIPGMEKALEGKGAGERLNIVIPPEEGYGRRDAALVNQVPLSDFPDKNDVKQGAQFHAQTRQGTRIATVVRVEGESVTLDFNHPLSDVTLHFDVEIVDVRDATPDEIAHGHVHGKGCSH